MKRGEVILVDWSYSGRAVSKLRPAEWLNTPHLEFAADAKLPDGYAWHDFVPV